MKVGRFLRFSSLESLWASTTISGISKIVSRKAIEVARRLVGVRATANPMRASIRPTQEPSLGVRFPMQVQGEQNPDSRLQRDRVAHPFVLEELHGRLPAGLLTYGSSALVHLPGEAARGLPNQCSPITVAGPWRIHTSLPFSVPHGHRETTIQFLQRKD